ncbi:siroheme synthase domain-containing protein [Spizellomyces punctatus DAOM BR117]|uniref:Siroheme synthase domain-containing protein n=1 Tax=Spizellomyces punctatus (strain DAOM BR117) TaxID=645134 RepID=A0A0L0HC10_SPIPD|nr:siroheme synthase domain-containing protein [Spizellomyces punctatus DAOM BR117]KNC98476.1 siroheme synthase domain-containing protein [Spizellomyces punctatus DAOM BR117]|eukprot:XP_016606516.1 siroheme synthase domain-containing protein [Spizellomyces punctatus DAOM BR117]
MVLTAEEAAPVARGGASLILAWSIAGRNVLVVGGNDVAAQRAFFALEADAYVTLVAPESSLSGSLRARVNRGELTWFNRDFVERDLEGKSMVLVAWENAQGSRHVAALSKQRKVPVNVADAPEVSDFWFMSTYRDHALQVAVSTNGNGPHLAGKLRRYVANSLPPNAGLAIQRLSVLRQRLRAADPSAAARRMSFITRISETWPFDKLAELTNEEIERIAKIYEEGGEQVAPYKVRSGVLRFVSAGTGDVELLTRAAYNAINSADVVVADPDVSQDILEVVTGQLIVLTPTNKRSALEAQLEEVALISLKRGNDVVRLVSGDALVFGGAADEVGFFRRNGFEAQIMPGMSSAFAVPSLTGISLTAEGVADNIVLVKSGSHAYPTYRSSATVVASVDTAHLQNVAAVLLQNGYPEDLPVAVAQGNSTLKATVSTIAALARKANFVGLATLIIGRVVQLDRAQPLQHVAKTSQVTSVPVSRPSTEAKPFSAYSAITEKKAVASERIGTVKCINGHTAASHVAYGLTDLSFIYPVATSGYVGEEMITWADHAVANAYGQSHKVATMSTRSGAASAVHGAISTGAKVTAVVSSEALPLMIPSMYQIAHARQPVVFHVAAQSITNEFSVITDYSNIIAASYTGFGLLNSASVQEAHDLAIVAHVAADSAKTPILHFFDGARIARETVKAKVIEYKDLEHVAQVPADSRDLVHAVEDAMNKLEHAFGRRYKLFEYSGAPDAETVVVTMGPAAALAQEAATRLNHQGAKVGVLNIRLLRPWSAVHFVNALPKSVKRLAVIDQSGKAGSGHGPLFLDVTACFYTGHWSGRIPAIINGHFAAGIQNFHPAAVEELFRNAASPNPIFDFVLESKTVEPEADARYVAEGVSQAVFWDLQESHTSAVSTEIVADMEHGPQVAVQSYTAHDDTQIDPASVTYLRYGTSNVTAPHLIHSADYAAVHDLSLLQRYNVAQSVKHGGSLVLNTHLAGDDLAKEVPDVIKSEISRRKIDVLTVDANGIAKDFTLFKGVHTEYVKLILQAVFLKVAPGIDFPATLRRLGEHVTQSETDRSVIVTKLGAIQRALSKIQHVTLKNIPTPEAKASLPNLVANSLPFAKLPLVEEEEETTARVVKSHAAIWPVIFPEAYKVEKKLRPDIEGAYQIKVTENRRVTPDTYDRNVFHIEMDIKGTGLKYAIGEALGVHGHNDVAEVERFLKFYGVNPLDVVYVDRKTADGESTSEVRTIAQMFTQVLDVFGKPGRKFYQAMLGYTKDPKQHEEIHNLLSDADAMQKFTDNETPTYADLLVKFDSCHPPVEDLVNLIPAIKPRHYSISSAQSMHPDSVHLLVVLVDWRTKSGKERFGQCTRYLVDAAIGQTLTVTIKPSVMKLPPSLTQPVIMSGLGTGMAPFRAFIEERAYWKAQGKKVGPMVLYFGSRHRAMEYLYGEEMEAYHADGLLTYLRLAFSRDQKQKVYIQHKITEDTELLGRLMLKEKGAFYLCGPTWPVPDVRDALVKAFESEMTKAEATELLEALKEEERYILEVY